jgi:hypothetical protein
MKIPAIWRSRSRRAGSEFVVDWGPVKLATLKRLHHSLFLLVLICCSVAKTQQIGGASDLTFRSSESSLNESFLWAKEQALAYVRPATGGIGPWYESALSGRDAFCIRDVSHQVQGAAALGLFEANWNMLNRLADSVSASRDWAGYWEIDETGKASAADYANDKDFWFNLPGNFDLLDAIERMWRWTGDSSYQDDQRMQTFFRETLTDYVAVWHLRPEMLSKRERIAIRHQATGKFVNSRGIPSYTEGAKDFIFGADLLAAEYRAFRSYRDIALSPEDRELAGKLARESRRIQDAVEEIAWSPTQRHFLGVFGRDLRGSGSGDTFVLYFGAVKDPVHLRGALDYISDPNYWKQINIEEESYVPLVLFRYGRTAAAYRVLMDLTAKSKPRREYPEVSFSAISALINGVMGIEAGRLGDAFDIQTLPQPLHENDDNSVGSLRIRQNVVDITHFGNGETRIVNKSGPVLRWRARFEVSTKQLVVNGRLTSAHETSLLDGRHVSWVTVMVPSGTDATVKSETR